MTCRRSRRCFAAGSPGTLAAKQTGELTDSDKPAIDPETGKVRKFAYAPNLVVVDGGAPQVNAAGRGAAGTGHF